MSLLRLFLLLVGATVLAHSPLQAAESGFNGRWRLDIPRSSALDGWTTGDLVFSIEGPFVAIRHDMTWRSTKVTGTNRLDTRGVTQEITDYFRIDQRHMAVYAPPGKSSQVTASWLDQNRTLKVEAVIPVEVSQGDAKIRTYSEYRLLEGDNSLLVIELHHNRIRPLVYHFTRVSEEVKK